MHFHADRRAALLYMTLAVLNIAMAIYRLVRHGVQDGMQVLMACFWVVVFLVWSMMLNLRWTFTEDALVAGRFGLGQQRVPYNWITAVNPSRYGRSKEVAVIVYGNHCLVTAKQELVANPSDYAGFLAELERHVPATVMHV